MPTTSLRHGPFLFRSGAGGFDLMPHRNPRAEPSARVRTARAAHPSLRGVLDVLINRGRLRRLPAPGTEAYGNHLRRHTQLRDGRHARVSASSPSRRALLKGADVASAVTAILAIAFAADRATYNLSPRGATFKSFAPQERDVSEKKS